MYLTMFTCPFWLDELKIWLHKAIEHYTNTPRYLVVLMEGKKGACNECSFTCTILTRYALHTERFLYKNMHTLYADDVANIACENEHYAMTYLFSFNSCEHRIEDINCNSMIWNFALNVCYSNTLNSIVEVSTVFKLMPFSSDHKPILLFIERICIVWNRFISWPFF